MRYLRVVVLVGLSFSTHTIVVAAAGWAAGLGGTGQPQIALSTGVVFGVNLPQFRQDNFLGIPYALPPIGERRFAAPASLAPNATRIIEATEYGKACMQPIQVSMHTKDPNRRYPHNLGMNRIGRVTLAIITIASRKIVLQLMSFVLKALAPMRHYQVRRNEVFDFAGVS